MFSVKLIYTSVLFYHESGINFLEIFDIFFITLWLSFNFYNISFDFILQWNSAK